MYPKTFQRAEAILIMLPAPSAVPPAHRRSGASRAPDLVWSGAFHRNLSGCAVTTGLPATDRRCGCGPAARPTPPAAARVVGLALSDASWLDYTGRRPVGHEA